MEKRKRKTYIIFLVGLVIGVLLFTGTFLLYLNEIDNGIVIVENAPDEEYDIPNGLVFSSVDDSLFFEGVSPTLDKFGVMEKGFSFSIKNTNQNDVWYELSLLDDNSTIKNSNIRYELTKNDNVIGINTLADDGVLEKSVIHKNETVNYTIKLWLDYNSEVIVGKLSKRIAINEVDEIKEINKPELSSGMIPVYYDSNTNSWYKADSNNSNNNWYSYEDKLYANAVTVNSEKREYYEVAKVGNRINIDDINSMWVWIPRFNYQMNDNEVDINFVSDSEKAYSAFTFNNYELSGFWFSKFEAGMKEDSECISSSITNSCNNTNNKLYFVPNYPVATKISMANIFYTIRKMELKNNIYGLKGTGSKVNTDGTIKNDQNDIDIHMILGSEWQAVALLSISKYGNNTIVNNNSNQTGKVSLDDTLYDYNVSKKGTKASTTGNVTGIYDMAGGKREYVMVNNDEINLFNKKSNSGFTSSVKDYYYDNDFSDSTLELKDKYGIDNQLNNEPITRGGYKNTGNIFSIYGASDYINKVSVETNSRACLIVMKEKNNE